MKTALFIGGTGTISAAITRLVATKAEWKLYLLNRGNRTAVIPDNVTLIKADINDPDDVAEKIKDLSFDCVCDFIGFKQPQVERDWKLFRGKTKQYMYISSASAYLKPCPNYIITEETPLGNPYWQYSRDKIACEEFLMAKYREEGYPVTIIRPSHTYDERKIPVGVHGKNGSWQVVKRIMEGKPVIVQGDGNSLWTVTHNSDFAKGFVGLMGNAEAVGQAFQITSDESLTWNQIYGCIADALGVEFKPYYVASSYLAAVGKEYDFGGSLFGDKACTVVFNNAKLKKAVPGFAATVPFAKGVKVAVDNILSDKSLQKDDPEFDAWCDKVIDSLEAAKRNW